MFKKSLERWRQQGRRAQEHQALRKLPDHLLADIGLTRDDLSRALR